MLGIVLEYASYDVEVSEGQRPRKADLAKEILNQNFAFVVQSLRLPIISDKKTACG